MSTENSYGTLIYIVFIFKLFFECNVKYFPTISKDNLHFIQIWDMMKFNEIESWQEEVQNYLVKTTKTISYILFI